MRTYRLFIDGDFVDAADGRTFDSVNPFSQEVVATVARAGPEDVRRAIVAARNAFDSGPWPRYSRAERTALLNAAAAGIARRTRELVALEVQDSGSTLRKAREDIYLSSRCMMGFAKLGESDLDGELPAVSRPGYSKNLLIHEPVGVVAAIIPWNFPLKMAVWKLGPALAAGNSVILKPSEETPATAMELAAIMAEAGFPKGVVNIVPGFGVEAGVELVRNPLVDMVAFTGSTTVGRQVMREAAGTLKKITLECGGKSANIVLDDADLSIAVDGALYAAFYHQGQCCEAGSRLFLPRSRADECIRTLVEKTGKMALGDPMAIGTDIGPLVSRAQQRKTLQYVQAGREEGARLVAGGSVPATPALAQGFFVEPTIFDHVRNSSTIAQDEIFGPVLSVIRYDTIEEAVMMANDSIYGLAGGVWSTDAERAMGVARRLRAGTVWINEWHILNEGAPFGGYRQSGIGREFGIDGIKEYMESKHIHIDESGRRDKKTWYDTVVRRT